MDAHGMLYEYLMHVILLYQFLFSCSATRSKTSLKQIAVHNSEIASQKGFSYLLLMVRSSDEIPHLYGNLRFLAVLKRCGTQIPTIANLLAFRSPSASPGRP